MDTFKEKSINSAYLTILILTVETVLLRESEQIFLGITICILLKEFTTILSVLYISGGEEPLFIPYLYQTRLSRPAFV